MRARWALLSALAIASAAVAGCGPKVKPGLGVVGDKTTARFDRAMVTDDKLGVDVADPPVRLKPSVPGKFRWLDTRTLAFVADDPLPRSTRFEVGARAGTRALDGLGLAKVVAWSFETERLRVTLGSPGRWATPDQRISVGFNQPVRRRDVEKRCAYVSDGKRVAAVVDNTGEAEETRDAFVALPHEALALGTKWRFECGAELTGAEGPLGLEEPSKQDFETYGPLKVTAVAPRGGEISPDEASIVITFSNPVAASAAAVPIKVQPAIEGFPERAAVIEDRVSYTVRALQPNTRYTITVDAAVADKFGQRLAGPHVAAFGTGDGTPRLDVETGAWVVESTRPGIPGVGAEPDVARGRHHRRARGKAGRARRASSTGGTRACSTSRSWASRRSTSRIPVQGRKNQWDQIADRARRSCWAARRRRSASTTSRCARPRSRTPGGGRSAPRELLLNFTNLGVTAKLSGPSGLVWVTRLSDGQPQPGAEVSIRDAKGKIRWRGNDRRGRRRRDAGPAQLLPKQKRRSATTPRPTKPPSGEEGEGAEGDFDGGGDFEGPRQRRPAGVRAPRQGHAPG